MLPYRKWTGPELAGLVDNGQPPTLALEGEVRARTGLWWDGDYRHWRGVAGGVAQTLTSAQVAARLRAHPAGAARAGA